MTCTAAPKSLLLLFLLLIPSSSPSEFGFGLGPIGIKHEDTAQNPPNGPPRAYNYDEPTKTYSYSDAPAFFSEFIPHSPVKLPVTYSLVFSYGTVAPDNFIQDSGILINGVFPGPYIRARPYDTLVIRVTNHLDHGIALHFHGIRNTGSPEADGVPHVTQEKIFPGETFQYVVPIGCQSGTFIYHLHTGLDSVWAFGPLIIEDSPLLEGKREYAYDLDYVFSLSQLWHNGTHELEKGLKGPGPFQDLPENPSILINGKSYGSWEGAGKNALNGGYDLLTVFPGKTYRFRVIGFGANSILSFAIENHRMTIIEVDGIIVKPVEVDHLEVNSGQRYSVLVTMDQETDNFWITSEMVPGPGPKNGKAILHYDRAVDASMLRKQVFEGKTEVRGLNQEMWEWPLGLRPNRKLKQPAVYSFPRFVDREIVIRSGEVLDTDGRKKYSVNDNFWVSPKTPYLFQVRNDGINITKEPQVYQIKTNKAIQIVFQNVANANGECTQHPWHVHGHTFYVVGHGAGEYDPVVDGPKLERKLRGRGKRRVVLRDVVTLCPNVMNAPGNPATGGLANTTNTTTSTTPTAPISTTTTSASPISSTPPSTPSAISTPKPADPPVDSSESVNRTRRSPLQLGSSKKQASSSESSESAEAPGKYRTRETSSVTSRRSSSSEESPRRPVEDDPKQRTTSEEEYSRKQYGRRDPDREESSRDESPRDEYARDESVRDSYARQPLPRPADDDRHLKPLVEESVEEDWSGESGLLMDDHSMMKHSLVLEGLRPSSGCGWVAVRFVTDNPGVWLVHCHFTNHLIMGKQFVLYAYPKDNPRLINVSPR